MEVQGTTDAPPTCIHRRLAWVAGLALAVTPVSASPKTILIFGPHEDDEIFLAAGIARAARTRGDTVKMILVTNGDINGASVGLARQGDSVVAAQTIGLSESDLVFLGYGDASLGAIYQATSGSQVFTSSAGQTATYGTRGLAGMDYHRYLYGVAGRYDRDTILGDFKAVLANFRPDEIYTPSYFDDHDDHQATALFIVEALLALQRSGVDLPAKLHQGMIWVPGAWPWPQAEPTGFTPWLPHTKPSCCLDTSTPFDWARALRVMVPPEMQSSTRATSLKWQAIQNGFGSYEWYSAWARRDEFFWLTDFSSNLATRAQVSVSSEDAANGRGRDKAVDGVLHGSLVAGRKEWATGGQLAGAWIQLDWPSPVSVAQVNLYDRPSLGENVIAGTITFSDGSMIPVGALPANGHVQPVVFPPKVVTWVRFTVDQAQGTQAGLSEIEVLGKLAGSTTNTPPHFLSGPGGPTDRSVAGGQSIALSVEAHDLDGDPLQYLWWAEAGTIAGGGPAVTFTAPGVAVDTSLAYSVTVLDGAGGSATNHGFLTVTPGPGGGGVGVDSLSVAPATVTAGGTALGTVTIAGTAPPGGQAIPLSSSNAAAAIPATVTVPAGASSASFLVTAGAVSVATSVTFTAFIGGAPVTAAFQVTPVATAGGANVAPSATVTVSSENTSTQQQGVKAVDGIVDGFDGATVGLPGNYTREWATRGELSGAWIQLNWSPAVAVQRVVLFDRPNASDQVIAGTLSFGDGSSVLVGALPSDARALIVDVPPRTVSWMRFRIDQAVGRNTGLSEVQVFGASAPPDAFEVHPASVVAGDPAQGTVTLGAAAPVGGITVSLASGLPAVASAPASVLVPAGSTSSSFAITTAAVASPTSVLLSAALPGGTKAATLTVTPLPVAVGIANVSLSPASVIGDQNVQGTVTLTGAAGSSGVTCNLAASDGTLASVPAAVVVPAGATSAIFTVAAGAVTATRSVIITASFAGSGASAALTIQPLVLASLSVSPVAVPGGASAQGSFTLNGVASGAVISLASSDPSAATVPATLAVALGASGGNFTVITSPIAADRTVTLTASAGASTRSTTLTVAATGLASITVDPASVPGGSSSMGTVTLTGPAPASGTVVALGSSATAAIVPASITVPAGSTGATFGVATTSVASSTIVVLTATVGAAIRTASLTVSPPGGFTLQLSSSVVPGGGIATATVTLGGAAAAGGAVVTLTSSNPATAQVPPSVTVPGGATTATFPVTALQVTSTRSATISAAFGGITRTVTLSVQRLSVSGLALTPPSVPGGGLAAGTVTLSAAAAGNGFLVTLSSNNPSAAAVPGSVTVAAGSRSATFTISTAVAGTTTPASISAAGGGSTRSASLAVTSGPAPLSLTVAPTSVASGWTSVGTVTLNGSADAGGTVVTLSSGNTSVATVPPTVTVLAGSLTATFPVTARTVNASTSVTISARAASVTKRVTLRVTP